MKFDPLPRVPVNALGQGRNDNLGCTGACETADRDGVAGLMNFTASDADITFDANAVARMRLEVALCPVSPKVELTAPG